VKLPDPRPGNALSIAPGKRVTTSMSPVMALREGRVVYALGLPGGRKIFPSALQRHAVVDQVQQRLQGPRRTRP
jgi:gamma-glutamyltranspeptidase / glutathione hydrolase